MEDIISRSGRNVDVVLATIATTLISPTLAAIATLLSALYVSSKEKENRAIYKMQENEYSKLREIVYGAIEKHNYGIRRKLIEYGFKEPEVERFLYEVVYEGYMNNLIATYA